MSRGKKPVDYAKKDEFKALLRKAEEAKGLLGACRCSFRGSRADI